MLTKLSENVTRAKCIDIWYWQSGELRAYRYLDDYASDDLANLTSKDALQKVSSDKSGVTMHRRGLVRA